MYPQRVTEGGTPGENEKEDAGGDPGGQHETGSPEAGQEDQRELPPRGLAYHADLPERGPAGSRDGTEILREVPC